MPPIYDPNVPDEICPVTTEDGWDMADRLAREEGLHVGHSSGANVFARRASIAGQAQREQGAAAASSPSCATAATAIAPRSRWQRL